MGNWNVECNQYLIIGRNAIRFFYFSKFHVLFPAAVIQNREKYYISNIDLLADIGIEAINKRMERNSDGWMDGWLAGWMCMWYRFRDKNLVHAICQIQSNRIYCPKEISAHMASVYPVLTHSHSVSYNRSDIGQIYEIRSWTPGHKYRSQKSTSIWS